MDNQKCMQDMEVKVGQESDNGINDWRKEEVFEIHFFC